MKSSLMNWVCEASSASDPVVVPLTFDNFQSYLLYNSIGKTYHADISTNALFRCAGHNPALRPGGETGAHQPAGALGPDHGYGRVSGRQAGGADAAEYHPDAEGRRGS